VCFCVFVCFVCVCVCVCAGECVYILCMKGGTSRSWWCEKG